MDTHSDLQVVARELSLSPAMLERMRRADDCLQCVSEMLETGVKQGADARAETEASARAHPDDEMRGEAWAQVVGLVRGYLETWPDDLSAMLVDELGRDD